MSGVVDGLAPVDALKSTVRLVHASTGVRFLQVAVVAPVHAIMAYSFISNVCDDDAILGSY